MSAAGMSKIERTEEMVEALAVAGVGLTSFSDQRRAGIDAVIKIIERDYRVEKRPSLCGEELARGIACERPINERGRHSGLHLKTMNNGTRVEWDYS